MAIATGAALLISLGTAVLVGGTVNEIDKQSKKKKVQDIQNAISRLQSENEYLNQQYNLVNDILTKIKNAKTYLEQGKSDFRMGGHVLDDVPLANPEFTSCNDSIYSVIGDAALILSDINRTIENNNRGIAELQAKLNK